MREQRRSYSQSSSSSRSSSSRSRRKQKKPNDKYKRDRQQKQKISVPYTPPKDYSNYLLSQIYKAISIPNINHHNLSQRKFHHRMRLKILQKKPIHVADSKVCIQAVFSNQKGNIINQQNQNVKKYPPLSPTNKLASQYYAIHLKPQIVFNCDKQILPQEKPLYPTPYHPAFYYLSYKQLRQNKHKPLGDKISPLLCEKIQVTSWSVRIVNISGSGYYAPILIIHEYIKTGNQTISDYVQNIIFCDKLTKTLQHFRVIDFRKHYEIKNDNIMIDENQNSTMHNNYNKQRISFSYYMKDKISGQKATTKSPFVNLDIKGDLLKNNQSLTVSFVPLGSVQQFNLFKRPIHSKYLCRQKHVNYSKFQLAQQKNNNINNAESQRLSSSDLDQYQFTEQLAIIQRQRSRQRDSQQIDEQDKQDINVENIQNSNQRQRWLQEYHISEQSEDMSQEDDHLRRIYQKKIQQNPGTII